MIRPEKIKLFHNVSSLHKLNYPAKARIWMKRDDTLDFAFGGNKVRLYEYIAAKAIKQGAKKLITFGSVHSNHNRVTAAVAAKLGMECDLIVLSDGGNNADYNTLGGNGKLIEKYGAKIIPCKTNDAHDFIDAYLAKADNDNLAYLWIPGGGHTVEAVYGYADVAKEIMQQAKEQGVNFKSVFLPCGTGTTQAGLIYGFNKEVDVIGITVARGVERCCSEIKSLLVSIEDSVCNMMDGGGYNCIVIDNMKQHYGSLDSEIIDVMKSLARTDGIFLDPIYNAKGFCGMLKIINSDDAYIDSDVLYVNTGGSPNVFS